MKYAYFEMKNGLPLNSDITAAMQGFEYLGYETKIFEQKNITSGMFDRVIKKDCFVAGIDTMAEIFKRTVTPESIDYPKVEDSFEFYRREIEIKYVHEVLTEFKEGEKVFVKPVKTKLFDGCVLSKPSQFAYFKAYMWEKAYVSKYIASIKSEWRGYVHRGELIDCRCYSGHFDLVPDFGRIREFIKRYENAPVAYTVDVGVTIGHTTVIVECNDFFAIGSYGMENSVYATMLYDRYNQLIIKE